LPGATAHPEAAGATLEMTAARELLALTTKGLTSLDGSEVPGRQARRSRSAERGHQGAAVGVRILEA
jgi:hypothetical protein